MEWAAWVLAVSTGAFLLWPFAKKLPGLNYLLVFLMGVHFTVCVYCALFIGPVQLMGTMLFFFLLFPLLVWVPVVFAVQALNRTMVSTLPWARVAFGLGVVALFSVQVWAELQYQAVEAAVVRLPQEQRYQVAALARVVPRSYMAERLAGASFKYHNYPDFGDDGWRPPLHDPLVNVCLWTRGGNEQQANPLMIVYCSPDAQASFCHQLFPQLPIKADCTCNQTHDGESYQGWIPNAGRRMSLPGE